MAADLIELVQRLGQPHVLVVGDVMLDRYIWGDAERISQEAPVLLLHADKKEERLGGASSVATMLRALGAKVSLAGVIGADHDGQRVRQMLLDLGIEHDGVIAVSERPTTVKERYIGRAQHRHPQQMLRVDYEVRAPLSAAIEEEVIRVIHHHIRRANIVLISDYDKGVCTSGLLAKVITAAKNLNLRVLADPIRGHDYRKYHGCSAITPNRLEAGLATGKTITCNKLALEAGTRLLETLDLEAAIVTLDKDGMALAHRDGRKLIVPTRPRQVYDITGAGDMVLSVLGMTLATGADYETAIRLANIAGGLEVEKIGVATVTRDEILRDLMQHGLVGNQKILERHQLAAEMESRRRLGQRIAFTNGCFDIIHAGHVQYLQDARAQADVLIVALNSDASIQALKGSNRPCNPFEARAAVLAALESVNYITVFDEATPLQLIELLRPDVLVKGGDYRKDDVIGASFVESYGGRVHLSPFRPGFSTTEVLRKLQAA
ncbi:MAG: D-glycero-beta-D-manno-heptose 1-phosphate adenylyltransferase [Gemmataceae bacterium]